MNLALDRTAPRRGVQPRSGRSPVTFTPLVRVVFWMTGALLAFSLMAVAMRVLAKSLSIPEILAVRSGTGLLAMLAMLAAMPTLRLAIRTRRPGLNCSATSSISPDR